MTRKDYIIIAEVLWENKPSIYSSLEEALLFQSMVEDFCKIFKKHNSNFNEDKFKKEIGYEY